MLATPPAVHQWETLHLQGDACSPTEHVVLTGIGVNPGPVVTSQVFDEHREWLHSIVDVASKVTERSICSKEDALLLLLTLIGDICTNIQAVARALAKLHLLRWGSAPCGGTSPHLGDDAELEQLLQAIHQGIGIWNPAGALLVGLKQTLCPSAVRAQLASLPVNPGLDAQLCSILEQGTKMGMAHPCANMRRVLEVSVVCRLEALFKCSCDACKDMCVQCY